MDVRKVQKSGSSSFIISLPLHWAKAHKLEKNRPVFIEENADGSLLVFPAEPRKALPSSFVLHLTGKERGGVLFRKMVAAYISGYGSIELVPGKGQSEKASKLAADFVSATVGQEIVEETDAKISIKDILNPAELPMQKAVRRMDSVCGRMNALAVGTLSGSRPSMETLEAMERDVDRLLWLVARKHHMFLRSPSSAASEGISLPESHLFFMCALNIERVADHARAICKEGAKFEKLHTLAIFAQSAYKDSTTALFSKDDAQAQQIIENVIGTPHSYESFLRGGSAPAWQVSCLASIRRISEYSAGICENLIDYTASQEQ